MLVELELFDDDAKIAPSLLTAPWGVCTSGASKLEHMFLIRFCIRLSAPAAASRSELTWTPAHRVGAGGVGYMGVGIVN